jgi:glycosyltransferase involved in cell wall biosynthesis
MYKITVCIPTYRRPEMLKQLLFSIFENKIDTSLINEMDIIIVDNDIEGSAEAVVNEINENAGRAKKLLYFNYPVKGLSNVRNELMRQAFLLNPDFVIFIDDDEYVITDWVNELMKTIIENGADVVRGPVIAKLDENVSKYIKYFFRRSEYPDNSQIYNLATGNLVMRRRSLENFNVRFDNRFNSTGSEDSFFGIQIMKKGAKIIWSAKAIAYETIPEKRAKLSWLIKRYFNGAVTYTYILKIEKKYLSLLKKSIVSIAYFLIGIPALLALPFPFQWKFWGILKISESVGGFAGLFSILFHEYKSDR